MTKEFVRVLTEVHCDWSAEPPIYRVYVDNELFTERTWIWKDCYLEEKILVEAEPGDYLIEYRLLDPSSASIRTENMRVDHGSATIHGSTLRIQ